MGVEKAHKIGSTLRIRMPADYKFKETVRLVDASEAKSVLPLTLREVTKQALANYIEKQALQILEPSIFDRPEPLTRWQRFVAVWQSRLYRIKGAWDVLRGRADVGDYW